MMTVLFNTLRLLVTAVRVSLVTLGWLVVVLFATTLPGWPE